MEQKRRTIRVFISSTFQDMQEERDVLIKNIFPELRKMCMDRGVGFTEVDLRWGVTQEQAEQGEVLPICLAEIESCRPYFIGLLGERYGWVPDLIPDELIDDQPWLAEHRERSVTELEIVHGVLNNPDMADHAFFYFRDPTASAVHSENQEEQDKQTALKNRIRQSGFSVSENYAGAEAVGQLILKDLKGAIDNEYPEQHLTPLEHDRLDHEVFAESRAKVYIGRQEYFDRLDDHASGTGSPLVVLGESGSGKSALLANWAFRYREKYPDTFLLTHFIGSSTDSADYAAMLRRIMMEIKERYDLQNDIPDTPEELRAQFPNWLSMAAARGRFILVLDALNQLEVKDNALDLVWLPEFIPPEVRLIVSTLPGRSLDELTKRGWPTMVLRLLESAERQQLIQEYLFKLYSKRLAQEQVERIASQQQCANPIFLHALLEELRIFGKHEEIESRIDHYLQANDAGKLYELVLTRLEQDYEKDRPGLVGEAMTLLWAARRGLSEPELLEIMDDLPPLLWAPLYLALHDSLVTRSGLLTFFHDFLRQAVHAKYIKKSETEKAAHLRIADYFEHCDINQRKIEELPWQLVQAEHWEKLYNLMLDLDFFNAAWETNKFEVLEYWQTIESQTTHQIVEAYKEVFLHLDQYEDYIWNLSMLLIDTGHLDEAQKINQYLLDHFMQDSDLSAVVESFASDSPSPIKLNSVDINVPFSNLMLTARKRWFNTRKTYDLLSCINNLAYILFNQNDIQGAVLLYKKQERICRAMGGRSGKGILSASLGNQANIFFIQGEHNKAMALFKEEESICNELDDSFGLQQNYGNQGNMLFDLNKPDEALGLYRKKEKICRKLGDKSELAASLRNQAVIFFHEGDVDSAIKLAEEAKNICIKIGDRDGLQSTLEKHASILKSNGDNKGTLKLLKERETICKSLGIKKVNYGIQGNLDIIMRKNIGELSDFKEAMSEASISEDLHMMASNLYERGEYEHALELLKEQEQICRRLENKLPLVVCLDRQGQSFVKLKRFDRALEAFEEQEKFSRKISNDVELSGALMNLAALLYHAYNPDRLREALPLAEEAVQLFARANPSKFDAAQEVLNHIRDSFSAPTEALEIFIEKEGQCRNSGDNNGIQFYLGLQATIHKDIGELERALFLLREKEVICRKFEIDDGLQIALNDQAAIHLINNERENAMSLLMEQEKICLKSENYIGLQASLFGQAGVLYSNGFQNEAISKYKEQEKICRDNHYLTGVIFSLKNQAIILSQDIRKEQDALKCIEEAIQLYHKGSRDKVSPTFLRRMSELYQIKKRCKRFSLAKLLKRIRHKLN